MDRENKNWCDSLHMSIFVWGKLWYLRYTLYKGQITRVNSTPNITDI